MTLITLLEALKGDAVDRREQQALLTVLRGQHHLMRIASLGSGSKGNATLVDTGETLILIDCGLPRQSEVEDRLQASAVPARAQTSTPSW